MYMYVHKDWDFLSSGAIEIPLFVAVSLLLKILNRHSQANVQEITINAYKVWLFTIILSIEFKY